MKFVSVSLILARLSKSQLTRGLESLLGKKLGSSAQQGSAHHKCLTDCRQWKSWDDGALGRVFTLIMEQGVCASIERREVVDCGKVCSQSWNPSCSSVGAQSGERLWVWLGGPVSADHPPWLLSSLCLAGIEGKSVLSEEYTFFFFFAL